VQIRFARVRFTMKTAVVWIAGGESYCQDAVESRDSVRRWNPNLPCFLATDVRNNIPEGYDDVIELSPRRYPNRWYLDSTRYANEAFSILYDDYDSLLFLDTDTLVDDNLDDMLRLSERFDIAVSHGVNRHTTGKVCNIPNSFPEHEIGVMLVQTNEHVRNLFKDWLELYESHPEVYGNNDQGPLRDAIWMNKLINMYVLPEEYHARWGFGVTVVSRVKILHSRSPGYPNSQAAKEINSVGGRRLFRPGGVWWRSVYGEEQYHE
jgi:hypothetical protein